MLFTNYPLTLECVFVIRLWVRSVYLMIRSFEATNLAHAAGSDDVRLALSHEVKKIANALGSHWIQPASRLFEVAEGTHGNSTTLGIVSLHPDLLDTSQDMALVPAPACSIVSEACSIFGQCPTDLKICHSSSPSSVHFTSFLNSAGTFQAISQLCMACEPERSPTEKSLYDFVGHGAPASISKSVPAGALGGQRESSYRCKCKGRTQFFQPHLARQTPDCNT